MVILSSFVVSNIIRTKERGNRDMTKKTSLELLKDEIAMKRGELNSLVEGDVDRQKLLKISMDLDELIYKYYMLEKEFKEDKAAE
ncbi:MAG: hypothetical protein ACFWUA_07795 [Sporanaerobacter sp.]|jgi:hypothetical protein